jgi:DNA-binding NarL/FixJ family response regulator
MRNQTGQPKRKAVPNGNHLLSQSSKITTSVLLADDSEVMSTAIMGLLQGIPDIQVLGLASGFAQTIELTAKLRPQVILIEIRMKDENSVTREDLKSCLTGSRVIAMSIWTDDETKSFAKAIGAVALLDKAMLGLTLIPAIRHFAGRQDCREAHA